MIFFHHGRQQAPSPSSTREAAYPVRVVLTSYTAITSFHLSFIIFLLPAQQQHLFAKIENSAHNPSPRLMSWSLPNPSNCHHHHQHRHPCFNPPANSNLTHQQTKTLPPPRQCCTKPPPPMPPSMPPTLILHHCFCQHLYKSLFLLLLTLLAPPLW